MIWEQGPRALYWAALDTQTAFVMVALSLGMAIALLTRSNSRGSGNGLSVLILIALLKMTLSNSTASTTGATTTIPVTVNVTALQNSSVSPTSPGNPPTIHPDYIKNSTLKTGPENFYNDLGQVLGNFYRGNRNRTLENKVDSYCWAKWKTNCSLPVINNSIVQFFTDRDKKSCYNITLGKILCGPMVEQARLKAPISFFPGPHLNLTGIIIHKPHMLACFPASFKKPTQFILRRRGKIPITTGPERQQIQSSSCLNLHYLDESSRGHTLSIISPWEKVVLSGCSALINYGQCIGDYEWYEPDYATGAPVEIIVPRYWDKDARMFRMIGTFVLNLRQTTPDRPCEVSTYCYTKGREEHTGVHRLKKYPTILSLGRQITSRKLLMSSSKPKCSSNSHFYEHKNYQVASEYKDGPGETITICNGSLISKVRLPSSLGCHTVRRVVSFHRCDEHSEDCAADSELKQCGNKKCISIHLARPGRVKLVRGSEVVVTQCERDCLLPVLKGKGDITIDCPGGTQHFLSENIVDVDCPGTGLIGSGMLYLCRMSKRPVASLIALVWIFLGYMLTTVICYCLFIILRGAAFFIKRIRMRDFYLSSVCMYCSTQMNSTVEMDLHNANCPVGLCPFCASRLPADALKGHTKHCPKKAEREKDIKLFVEYRVMPKALFLILNSGPTFRRMTQQGAWLLVTILLLLYSLSPVQGNITIPVEDADTGMQPSLNLWDMEEDLVDNCYQECFISDDTCECDVTISRKLLFFKALSSRGLERQSKLLSSLSIEAPWGLINAKKTFRPVTSASNIMLTWNTEVERGGKVHLSGRSSSIIKLKEKTGVVWELSSSLASEKKKLVVSVMDFSQTYNAVFEYLTGDRTVSEWPRATCTGDCPANCGCQTSTCFQKTWPHSRNWRCNPTWCWGIGTGCTCCGIDVENFFNKYLATKWQLEYIKTDVIVCVELTSEERHCDMVQAGSQFSIGPVRVTISDPQNIQNTLPSEVLALQELTSNKEFDLMHVTKLISAKNACKLQSCTHGSAGDLQIVHINHLQKDLMSTKFNMAELHSTINSSWMSWEGCDLDYYCNTGGWPTCSYTGVVKENTVAFDNLVKLETNLLERYFFHSKKVMLSKNLGLDLRARPNYGGGELTVNVEVNGLELHSKEVHITGLEIVKLACSGCYQCASGFSCAISLSIATPEEFTLHLRSLSPSVVIADGSVTVRRMSQTTSKIRGFSSQKVKEICIEVQEGSLCSSCSKQDYTKCTETKLDPPSDILLEHRGTIVSNEGDNCESGFSCWIQSSSAFVSGLGQMLRSIFGGIVVGVVFIALILLALWVLPWMFRKWRLHCLCCRKLRGLKSRKALVEDEFKKLIKTINKGGDYFKELGLSRGRLVKILGIQKGEDGHIA